MKLISDFDGVLTELSHEALRVKELFTQKCHACLVDSNLGTAEAAVRAAPEKNGWEVNGRLSAFADEDSFIFNNALAAWLDHHGGVPQIHFKELAQSAYETMVTEVLHSATTPLDGETKSVMRRLTEKNCEVVVVSNSGTERILDIFKKNHIPATSHPEYQNAQPRVRGGAQKYALTTQTSAVINMDIAGRCVEVSRPAYAQIIREERPDAIMGDVFSLDLATPLYLARTEPTLFPNGIKLILRRRDYTPKWILDYFRSQHEENVSFLVLESLKDLPVLLSSEG